MTNIDIDNDVEIATEETIRERELEIVARYTAQSEIVESEDEEEPDEPDPVLIPQNADMRKMLDQLRTGLETKGFPSMEVFDSFAGENYSTNFAGQILYFVLPPTSHCYFG